MVDCSNKNHACNGGLMNLAFEFVKYWGLETEEDYAYTARKGQCKLDKSKSIYKISGYK